MDYQKIRLNNANLHIFKTKKFKKISINVIFTDFINETNMSYRTLLARTMESKSLKYDTKQKINRKLDMLYGASFGISSSKNGKTTYINASIDGVNPKYVGDDKLLDDYFLFLHDMIFNPIFDKKNVSEEKRLLFDDYNAEYENKAVYAAIRCSEIAFSDELARLKFNGDKKIVEKITGSELKDYYKYVLENNKVDIIVLGDVSDNVVDIAKKYFDIGKNNNYNPIDYEDKVIKKALYVKEEAKSMQSQLMIKYRTKTRKGDSDHIKMVVANTIFGGFSSSLLFSNVREKASLAYSISSTNAIYKGCITVSAGIKMENYEKTLNLINEQLENMKKGNFPNELVEMAKLSIISSIKKGSDSLGSIARQIYISELLDEKFDLYDYIDEVSNISKDDIIYAINKLELDVVYFLEGSECDD